MNTFSNETGRVECLECPGDTVSSPGSSKCFEGLCFDVTMMNSQSLGFEDYALGVFDQTNNEDINIYSYTFLEHAYSKTVPMCLEYFRASLCKSRTLIQSQFRNGICHGR